MFCQLADIALTIWAQIDFPSIEAMLSRYVPSSPGSRCEPIHEEVLVPLPTAPPHTVPRHVAHTLLSNIIPLNLSRRLYLHERPLR